MGTGWWIIPANGSRASPSAIKERCLFMSAWTWKNYKAESRGGCKKVWKVAPVSAGRYPSVGKSRFGLSHEEPYEEARRSCCPRGPTLHSSRRQRGKKGRCTSTLRPHSQPGNKLNLRRDSGLRLCPMESWKCLVGQVSGRSDHGDAGVAVHFATLLAIIARLPVSACQLALPHL